MGNILKSQQDVINRLIDLDYDITNSDIELENKISFIIFGGVALLLYSNTRVTSDVDVIFLSNTNIEEVKSILENYNVNNRMTGLMQFPPFDDFYGRSKKLEIEFQNIEVYIPSREDLVLSKLFSDRGKNLDELDLIESNILDTIDLEYVRSMYEDYKSYRIGNNINISDLDTVLQLRKEYKEKHKILKS